MVAIGSCTIVIYHIWSLTTDPPTLTIRDPNSTPIVCELSSLTAKWANHIRLNEIRFINVHKLGIHNEIFNIYICFQWNDVANSSFRCQHFQLSRIWINNLVTTNHHYGEQIKREKKNNKKEIQCRIDAFFSIHFDVNDF